MKNYLYLILLVLAVSCDSDKHDFNDTVVTNATEEETVKIPETPATMVSGHFCDLHDGETHESQRIFLSYGAYRMRTLMRLDAEEKTAYPFVRTSYLDLQFWTVGSEYGIVSKAVKKFNDRGIWKEYKEVIYPIPRSVFEDFYELRRFRYLRALGSTNEKAWVLRENPESFTISSCREGEVRMEYLYLPVRLE